MNQLLPKLKKDTIASFPKRQEGIGGKNDGIFKFKMEKRIYYGLRYMILHFECCMLLHRENNFERIAYKTIQQPPIKKISNTKGIPKLKNQKAIRSILSLVYLLSHCRLVPCSVE